MIQKYGIDFGTTNSSIAVRFADANEVERTIVADLKDRYPKETIPSVVCICEDGNIFVGMDAYEKLGKLKAAGKEARLIKRVKMDLERKGSGFKYKVGNRTFDGVDLIAAILRYLRERADQELISYGVKASGVVMGVPVQYGDIQKDVLKSALVKAGYYQNKAEANRFTEFVSEPVAVAVHYGLNVTDNKTVMVFDFGGGTLDLAIVNLKEQVGLDHLHPHEVKAKSRMTIGGEELTRLFFVNTFCGPDGYGTKEICRAFRFDKSLSAEELWDRLSENNIGVELLDEVEQCKCELSISKTYDFSFLGPKGITLESRKIFRTSFEEAIEPILQQIGELIDNCLIKANIDDPFSIDHVIIAGGSSLIPCVQDLLYSKFGKKKVSTRPGSANRISGNFSQYTSEKEVLTSIVRGLAAVGCRKEELVEDVVDNDYGLWIDAIERFEPIIRSGTPVKDASVFDKVFQSGSYRDVKTQYEDQSEVTIKVYQRNLNGEEQLGSIFIEDAGGQKYRIFMHVDSKQGVLVVDVYDRIRKNWIEIPLNQKQYNIKNT